MRAAIWKAKFDGHLNRLCVLLPVVRLGLGRRDVADGLEQLVVVEPRHPLQRGQFDRLACLPRPAPVDDFGLARRTRRRVRPTRSISTSTRNPNVMTATAEIYRKRVAQSRRQPWADIPPTGEHGRPRRPSQSVVPRSRRLLDSLICKDWLSMLQRTGSPANWADLRGMVLHEFTAYATLILHLVFKPENKKKSPVCR